MFYIRVHISIKNLFLSEDIYGLKHNSQDIVTVFFIFMNIYPEGSSYIM